VPGAGRFFGIRAKLLAFYGMAIMLVVAAEFASQASSARANRDYERRLSGYHAVHRFRVSFEAHRALTERLLREGISEDGERQLHERALSLVWLFEDIRPVDPGSLPAFFEAQAAERALDAYLPLAESALARRRAGDPDYYADYAKADRIARYADGYLSKLLSIELEQGETLFRVDARNAARARGAALGAIIGIGAFALLFSSLAATRLTLPLRRLAEASERIAAGDLDVAPVGAAPGDEVAVLAAGFNSMSASIRRMVADLRRTADLEMKLLADEAELARAERSLAEARFMALQDQMRPHFLFNALNAIARSALLEGAGRTTELAHGLGRLMRYALGGPEPFVPLEEEFAVIHEYLAFQAVRFGERLSWRAALEPELAAHKVPRFSIQPLVENAVRHGVEPMERGGRILVDVRRRRNLILVRVFDSGVGIEPERLRAIRQAIGAAHAGAQAGTQEGAQADQTRKPGEAEAETGLGLANLAGRLGIRYRGAGRVSLLSSPGRGTVVRVSFPAEAPEASL
jgi:two-component system, sensor histidine kinase YesM